jgi:hypothetical protein
MRTFIITCTSIVACCVGLRDARAYQVTDMDEAAIQNIARKVKERAGSRTIDEPRPGQTVPNSYREHKFQQGPKCGPNAVFICLRLLGYGVSYNDVISRTHLEQNGADMEELVRVAESFGLKLQPLKKVGASDLKTMRGPVIVHLDTPESNNNGQSQDDHFTVLLTYDSAREVFKAIDTSSCTNVDISMQYIARSFSGHCLVPGSFTPNQIHGTNLFAIGALAILATWWATVEIRILRVRRRLNPA